jgi:hypothetical protein
LPIRYDWDDFLPSPPMPFHFHAFRFRFHCFPSLRFDWCFQLASIFTLSLLMPLFDISSPFSSPFRCFTISMLILLQIFFSFHCLSSSSRDDFDFQLHACFLHELSLDTLHFLFVRHWFYVCRHWCFRYCRFQPLTPMFLSPLSSLRRIRRFPDISFASIAAFTFLAYWLMLSFLHFDYCRFRRDSFHFTGFSPAIDLLPGWVCHYFFAAFAISRFRFFIFDFIFACWYCYFTRFLRFHFWLSLSFSSFAISWLSSSFISLPDADMTPFSFSSSFSFHFHWFSFFHLASLHFFFIFLSICSLFSFFHFRFCSIYWFSYYYCHFLFAICHYLGLSLFSSFSLLRHAFIIFAEFSDYYYAFLHFGHLPFSARLPCHFAFASFIWLSWYFHYDFFIFLRFRHCADIIDCRYLASSDITFDITASWFSLGHTPRHSWFLISCH